MSPNRVRRKGLSSPPTKDDDPAALPTVTGTSSSLDGLQVVVVAALCCVLLMAVGPPAVLQEVARHAGGSVRAHRHVGTASKIVALKDLTLRPTAAMKV